MKTNIITLALFSLTGCMALALSFSGCSVPDQTLKPMEKSGQLEQQVYRVKMPDSGNQSSTKDIIAVTINPAEYRFSIYINKDVSKAKTIKEIHEETLSALTLNGNFFTEDFTSTGLLISEGKSLHQQSKAALLNGIIALDKEGKAHFFDSKKPDLPDFTSFEFAIQSGPVLLQKGEIAIAENSTETASRTALGIDTSGNLVVIVVKQSLLKSDNVLSLAQFARILKESQELKNLQLEHVLNLDGGRSTGLMIGEHYYAELDYVQNAITVKKRS